MIPNLSDIRALEHDELVGSRTFPIACKDSIRTSQLVNMNFPGWDLNSTHVHNS